MMKYLSILTVLTVLSACATDLGLSRAGDTIFVTGPLNCTVGSVHRQALVVGTNADPVRCEPQSQPVG
jgi:hypothetical protein